MKIRRIAAYQVDLPLYEGSYRWSGGKSVTVFDSTIARVDTDAGIVGHGEVCPLGPSYLPAYAAGVRAGIAELGPHLIGEDPTELGRLNRRMDAALKGHPYVKSGIDIACWDILGQAAGLPVCTLLGGVSLAAKLNGCPDRLIADANTGWLMHDTARVVRAVRDVDVYIEQPCASFEECLSIRRRTDHPFVMDESIDDIDVLLRSHAEGAMDVVNLKISKLGGIHQASSGA